MLKNTQSKEEVNAISNELKSLEQKVTKSILPLIIQEAKTQNCEFFRNFIHPPFASIQEVIKLRYIYVPIFYKLGMTHEASQLAQETFEYLFPQIHTEVSACLIRLFGENYKIDCENIINRYLCKNEDISQIAYRVKSSHSIWKNIENFSDFEKMTRTEFCNYVNDFIGIRWEMKLQQDQNRFDALINGVRVAPTEGLIAFRNQQLAQANGFDKEPVMKLCYVLDGKPIELQLLGGNITAYMCAKGYTLYKAKIPFSPDKNSLSSNEWNCRMGMVLQCTEGPKEKDFHQYMYDELVGNEIEYKNFKPFILDDSPKKSENRSLYFSTSLKPIYELSQLSFEKEPQKFDQAIH